MHQQEIDQQVFDLYDEYCHGYIDRREFLSRSAVLTIAGVSALAMAQSLLPRYAEGRRFHSPISASKGGTWSIRHPAGRRERCGDIWCSRRGMARFPPCS